MRAASVILKDEKPELPHRSQREKILVLSRLAVHSGRIPMLTERFLNGSGSRACVCGAIVEEAPVSRDPHAGAAAGSQAHQRDPGDEEGQVSHTGLFHTWTALDDEAYIPNKSRGVSPFSRTCFKCQGSLPGIVCKQTDSSEADWALQDSRC